MGVVLPEWTGDVGEDDAAKDGAVSDSVPPAGIISIDGSRDGKFRGLGDPANGADTGAGLGGEEPFPRPKMGTTSCSGRQ